MEYLGVLGLVLAGAAEGAHFDWSYFAQHAVNFLILIFVLGYFLRTPVKNFLVERRGLIANEIDDARAKIEDAKRRFEEYSEKIRNIDREIEDLRVRIWKESEIERKQIIEQAEAAAKRIVEDAREVIRLESEKAMDEIRREFVGLTMEASEELIRKHKKPSDDKKLIDQFIKITEEYKWRQ